MSHENHLGLPDATDRVPDGVSTLVDTALVALAAVVGVAIAAVAAALVAPVGPAAALATLVVGWPVGFLAAAFALRAGLAALVRSGLPADARAALRRSRGATRPPVATDGGAPRDDDAACE